MKELWKDIKNWEGFYQVSNLGRVRSLRRGKTRILRPLRKGGGYFRVELCFNGEKHNCSIHRLVATAFIPNPLNLPVINHKDENPSNNAASNLEWCTHKYNMNYGTCKARIVEKLSKPVVQYSLSGEFIKEWRSIKEIERQTNFIGGAISRCCNMKQKSSYGFVWRFK